MIWINLVLADWKQSSGALLLVHPPIICAIQELR